MKSWHVFYMTRLSAHLLITCSTIIQGRHFASGSGSGCGSARLFDTSMISKTFSNRGSSRFATGGFIRLIMVPTSLTSSSSNSRSNRLKQYS